MSHTGSSYLSYGGCNDPWCWCQKGADEVWDQWSEIKPDPWADLERDAEMMAEMGCRVCGDPECNQGSSFVSKLNSVENQMSENLIGQSGVTSNEFINSLPKGAILEVVGPGEVTVVDVLSKVDLTPGSRIYTKHGPSTVVRASSRLEVFKDGGRPLDGYVLYVADSDPAVVRRINAEDASQL